MEIFHDEARGLFYCDVEGHRCVIEYRKLDEDVFDLYRTSVHSALRGRGIAEKLLVAALAFVCENGKKIIPSCSYVAAHFRQHPEQHNLLTSSTNIGNGMNGHDEKEA